MSEWKFEDGDLIRETEQQFAPGGIAVEKAEYAVTHLLCEPDGTRYYYVEATDSGNGSLYHAKTLELNYEVSPRE